MTSDDSTAPSDFIRQTVAEELGLVRMLDKRVLEMTVATLIKRPDVSLALNVSGLTTTDVSWVQRAIDLVASDRSLASRLTVEITETVVLQDITELSNFVAILHDIGCKVAIDDFGAGYTSYRNLKSLDVDTVKIDGAFVRGITDSEDNQFYVGALNDLAHHFNLKTVAECVETEEEAEGRSKNDERDGDEVRSVRPAKPRRERAGVRCLDRPTQTLWLVRCGGRALRRPRQRTGRAGRDQARRARYAG